MSMGNEFKGQVAHSAEYFGATRDHWWNRDFLELLARRWQLDAVRSVLDVGCGVGHWGALLSSVLEPSVQVTGIDREPSWIHAATERSRKRGVEGRFTYHLGDVCKLPFPDDTFDLTTCQTVLIHLADPALGIREMLRVTKPGGRVLVAEPNNLAESLQLDSVANQASVDELAALVHFQLTCERGKVALGEGDNSLGNRVPGMFVAAGLAIVEVYVNDKATAVFPPYDTEPQRALIDDAEDRWSRRLWIWSEAETRRFFLAGGGAEEQFAAAYARGLEAANKVVQAVRDGTYHATHGGAFFVVSGRKRQNHA